MCYLNTNDHTLPSILSITKQNGKHRSAFYPTCLSKQDERVVCVYVEKENDVIAYGPNDNR